MPTKETERPLLQSPKGHSGYQDLDGRRQVLAGQPRPKPNVRPEDRLRKSCTSGYPSRSFSSLPLQMFREHPRDRFVGTAENRFLDGISGFLVTRLLCPFRLGASRVSHAHNQSEKDDSKNKSQMCGTHPFSLPFFIE